MRFIFFAIFAFSLVATPFYMLDHFVMPELGNLQQAYAHEDQTVQTMFPQQ